MSLFTVVSATPDTIMLKTSLVSDPRLSVESLGMLCFVCALSHKENFSVDDILGSWNAGRSKEHFVGKDKFRRMVNEWKKSGYVGTAVEYDETGKTTGKLHSVFPQSRDDLALVKRPEPASGPDAKVSKSNASIHKFPAAQIFQTHFSVDLDLDAMQYIEREATGEIKLWAQVCADHYNSLTEQQKSSLEYKTRAVKFCLNDLRSMKERRDLRRTKTPYQQEAEPEVKKKTFTDYIESGGYDYGSEKYETFKNRWIEKANEKGNQTAIEQVEEYEGIQLSLAAIQKRKGGPPK